MLGTTEHIVRGVSNTSSVADRISDMDAQDAKDSKDIVDSIDDIEPIISLITQWQKGTKTEKRTVSDDLGGTMRLGAYDCVIDKNTLAAKVYGGKDCISERHRHRYELNPAYEKQLNSCGMVISGRSKDGKLPEIIEIKSHPWFLGVQFHPEFNSTPLCPSSLFVDFIRAAKKTGIDEQ